MTRKEAIWWLEGWRRADEVIKKKAEECDDKKRARYYAKAIKAYDIAIAALKRKEQEEEQ